MDNVKVLQMLRIVSKQCIFTLNEARCIVWTILVSNTVNSVLEGMEPTIQITSQTKFPGAMWIKGHFFLIQAKY